MVYGKKINIEKLRESRNGAYIAIVNLDTCNVNQEMVKKGFAWVHQYFSDDKNLIDLQDKARVSKIGLWHDEKPTAPWDYRREQRALRQYKHTNSNQQPSNSVDSANNT